MKTLRSKIYYVITNRLFISEELDAKLLFIQWYSAEIINWLIFWQKINQQVIHQANQTKSASSFLNIK